MNVPVSSDEALALAESCLAQGAMAEGLEAAQRALAGPSSADDHARAAWLTAHFQFRLGAYAELIARREELAAPIRQGGGRAYFDHRRMMGLAACELGEFGVAMAIAREIGALADAADDPVLRAFALMALAMCFERMGDPWQAERLMRDALPLMREHGGERDRFLTVNNLCATLIGAFYLLRGEGVEPEAVAAMERALPLAREIQGFGSVLTEPTTRAIASGNLGEVLLHLGQTDEARECLAAALDLAKASALSVQRHRIECSLAELALLLDDPAQALAEAQRLLAEGGLLPQTELRARHAAYVAARRLGDISLALEHLERRTDLERRRAILQLRAQSDQFITRVEVEHTRRDADRHRQRAQAMEADALRDPLTGLGNRRALAQRLPTLLSDAAATSRPLGMAMLDLDHFKSVNDRFGHLVGDQVLEVTAQILRQHLRGPDLVARTGGEEFLVVWPDTPPAQVRQICERIRQAVEGHDWSTLSPGLSVTISVGCVVTPPYDAADLTARADAALYRAKAAGRNRVEVG
jgi:diguanylate cyclase (GGDEF)-like protein